MSDTDERLPRRSDRHRKKHAGPPAPEPGFRASRHSSKKAERAGEAGESGRVQSAFAAVVARLGRGLTMALVVLVGLALAAGLVFLGIVGINGYARWAGRRAADEQARTAAARKVRENLLVIAVQEKEATGFLAMRVDTKSSRVFGIAIPDGAFVEVPGQGFVRIGDSYKSGASVSLAAVSNYLSVPFDYYVTIDDAAYKSMLKQQDVSGLSSAVIGTNLPKDVRQQLDGVLKKVPAKNVGLAPLPVRSVTIGNITYYEPQRDQIADLLYSWWGVRFGQGTQMPRAIVYNGSGTPEIAGVAAQQLIKAGFRVVATGNADRFDYASSEIVLLRGEPAEAARVRDILGVGEIVRKQANQDITDVVVIVGKDYKPSAH